MNDLQKIIDEAPEGATHVSDNGVYYFMNYPVAMNYWSRGQEWVESGGIHHLCRALADLREIVALRAENVEQQNTINARNQMINEMSHLIAKEQAENAELREALMQVKDWVNKVDPLINGCSIEKEFYGLSDMLHRGESND